MGNKKCTANYDCFNCPFPDCIDDSPFDPLNDSPKKRAKLKSIEEKREQCPSATTIASTVPTRIA